MTGAGSSKYMKCMISGGTGESNKVIKGYKIFKRFDFISVFG